MSTCRYNLEDVNKIKLSGFSFDLPKTTQDLIMNLSKLVGSPDYIKTPTFQKKKRDPNEPDWDLIKQFKPTAKVERSDNEEIMQSIKRAMNKMTDKNYDTLKEEIMTSLVSLENTDVFSLILDIIFNLASSNRFYSKVYASLYKELMEKSSDIFAQRIESELEKYVSRFTEIKNINANEDYEGFCDNNKRNEELKALTEFFSNLMIMGVIHVDKLYEIFQDQIKLIHKYLDNKDEKHTIIELSENIFIQLKSGAVMYSESNKFTEMVGLVSEITKLKVKEHPGLSNKSLFKLMDIIDIKV